MDANTHNRCKYVSSNDHVGEVLDSRRWGSEETRGGLPWAHTEHSFLLHARHPLYHFIEHV